MSLLPDGSPGQLGRVGSVASALGGGDERSPSGHCSALPTGSSSDSAAAAGVWDQGQNQGTLAVWGSHAAAIGVH